MRDEPGSNPAPGTHFIWREHVEEPIQVPLPLTGWALRRHSWAISISHFACWVRGWHRMAWEPDWKDWYCSSCYQTFDKKDPVAVMAFVEQHRERRLVYYNPQFGDERPCARALCGHSYYRHFDTHDGMAAVGCKYCHCEAFVA